MTEKRCCAFKNIKNVKVKSVKIKHVYVVLFILNLVDALAISLFSMIGNIQRELLGKKKKSETVQANKTKGLRKLTIVLLELT